MNKVFFVIFILAFSVFAQQTSVAVLPSESSKSSLSNDELNALTKKMRKIALKVLPSEKFTLLNHDAIVKRLGGTENYIKERSESSSIAEFGKKAQVDYIAQANVGQLRDKMRINVAVYNVRTGALVGMYSGDGKYFKTYSDLLKAVDKDVPEIFLKIPGAVLPPPRASSGTFTDTRDGKKYKYVKMGEQIWMAENLNYDASGSKCYDNKPENCAKYGRLHNWKTAQTACPPDWHLPSYEEWQALMFYFVCQGGRRSFLTDGSGGGFCQMAGSNGCNFSFSATPGGLGTETAFNFIGESGFYWGSNIHGEALGWVMNCLNGDVQWSKFNKSLMFSVRCVEDD